MYSSHRTIHYSSHPTRYDIITNGRYTLIRVPCTLPSVYQVFCTNMISSYRTINRITRLIIYAWINSIVIILGGTDRHGRDNEFNKEVDNPSSSSNMPTYSVVRTNTIIYNNQACHATIHLPQLI